MRGKVAKRLRRAARESGINEERNYMKHKDHPQLILGKCVRNVYQRLKKAYKDGILSETGSSAQAG